MSAFAAHTPTGVSLWSFAQYLQLAGNGRFEMVDLGPTKNLIRYEQTCPPEYPLNQINSTEIAIFHSANDPFSNIDDVNKLKNSLSGS